MSPLRLNPLRRVRIPQQGPDGTYAYRPVSWRDWIDFPRLLWLVSRLQWKRIRGVTNADDFLDGHKKLLDRSVKRWRSYGVSEEKLKEIRAQMEASHAALREYIAATQAKIHKEHPERENRGGGSLLVRYKPADSKSDTRQPFKLPVGTLLLEMNEQTFPAVYKTVKELEKTDKAWLTNIELGRRAFEESWKRLGYEKRLGKLNWEKP